MIQHIEPIIACRDICIKNGFSRKCDPSSSSPLSRVNLLPDNSHHILEILALNFQLEFLCDLFDCHSLDCVHVGVIGETVSMSL